MYCVCAGDAYAKEVALLVVAKGRDPATTHVSSVMMRHPLFVSPSMPAITAMGMMMSKRFRYLPFVAIDGIGRSLLGVYMCHDSSYLLS